MDAGAALYPQGRGVVARELIGRDRKFDAFGVFPYPSPARPPPDESHQRGPSVRFLGVLFAPLWVPVALVLGLTRICGEGLLFSLETLLGRPLALESSLLRVVFDLFALVAFPIFVTLETFWSLLVSLSALLLRGRGEALPWVVAVPLRAALGLAMLATAPIWMPLYGLLWLLWRTWREVVEPTVHHLGKGGRPQRRGRFETFVALRYMRGRKSAGVSVVTGLTTAGVTVGVWTLIVVLSVMAGFEYDLQEKILGANSHVIVRSYWDRIDDWPAVKETVDAVDGVVGSTPFLYSELLLRSKTKGWGAIIKGIDPDTVGDVTTVLDDIVLGPQGRVRSREEARELLSALDDPAWKTPLGPDGVEGTPPPKVPGVVIGQEMAASLAVTVGDTIRATSLNEEPGPMGMRARVEEFVVVGIFHSGMYEYDMKFAYARLDTVSRFLRMDGGVTGLEVKVDDIYEAPRIAKQIQESLRYPIWTQDWQKMNEGLFKALKLEKTVMGIILTFIVAVASLNIISTLSMMVIEKKREIAILKSMGANRVAILKLFMIDGLIIGFIGTVLGIALGLATCWALARYEFIELSSDVYYVDKLPVHVSPTTVGVVAIIAVSISFLATLYPSSQGADLDPVEGLRDA